MVIKVETDDDSSSLDLSIHSTDEDFTCSVGYAVLMSSALVVEIKLVCRHRSLNVDALYLDHLKTIRCPKLHHLGRQNMFWCPKFFLGALFLNHVIEMLQFTWINKRKNSRWNMKTEVERAL
jgi:hypothetical protein